MEKITRQKQKDIVTSRKAFIGCVDAPALTLSPVIGLSRSAACITALFSQHCPSPSLAINSPAPSTLANSAITNKLF